MSFQKQEALGGEGLACAAQEHPEFTPHGGTTCITRLVLSAE